MRRRRAFAISCGPGSLALHFPYSLRLPSIWSFYGALRYGVGFGMIASSRRSSCSGTFWAQARARGVGNRDEFSPAVGERNRFDRTVRHFRRRDRSAVLRVAFVREHREPGVIRGCGLRELRQRRRSLRQPFRWRIQWGRRGAERLHKRRSRGTDLRAQSTSARRARCSRTPRSSKSGITRSPTSR